MDIHLSLPLMSESELVVTVFKPYYVMESYIGQLDVLSNEICSTFNSLSNISMIKSFLQVTP